MGKDSIAISAPLLVNALGGRNRNKRSDAFGALLQLRKVPPDLVDSLVKLADDPRAVVARHAIEVLGEAGSAARRPLLKLLKDSRASIEIEVLTSLGKLDPKDSTVHQRLRRIAGKKSRRVTAASYNLDLIKNWAVEGRYTGPDPVTKRKPVTRKPKQLTRLLAIQDLKIRLEACESLFRLQPKNNQIAPALVKVLTNGDAKLQLETCNLISKMKSSAVITAPQLAKLLESRKIIPDAPNQPGGRWLATAAGTALRSLGNAGVNVFTRVLKHEESAMRGMAACWLGSMGRNAKLAIPHLVAQLDDKGIYTVAISNHFGVPREVRMTAAQALGDIGPAAKVAIPRLMQMLQVDGADTYAVRALGQIGCRPKRVIPQLLKIATDNSFLAIEIVTAIHKLDPMHAEIVPRLRKILKQIDKETTINKEYFFRMRKVVDVIIQLGRRGHFLKPELVDFAVLHEFMAPNVRFEAALALAHLDPKKPKWRALAWRIARKRDISGLYWDRYREMKKLGVKP